MLRAHLDSYNQAFNNISSCASILAGFAFTGLMLDPFDDKNELQPSWLVRMLTNTRVQPPLALNAAGP